MQEMSAPFGKSINKTIDYGMLSSSLMDIFYGPE
jgi:hypothetical protein